MKMIFCIAAVLAISVSSYGVYNLQKRTSLSGFAKENAEALADEESVDSYDCPGGRIECVRVLYGNEIHIYYKN